MAAPTLVQVMQAIETALDAIPGLRANDVSPDQIVPPCAIVGVPDIDSYRLTMKRGQMSISPTITVFVSGGYSKVAQLALASYADVTGTHSVINAVEADKTLGGLVGSCHVVDFHVLGMREVGAVQYYCGVFSLSVVATGA